jgi:nitroreductase
MSDNRLFALESSAVDIILARCSALKLSDPGPTPEDLDTILAAGARAPDHGRLRPWRFVVVQGDARGRLGGILAHSLRTRDPSVTEPQLLREREKASRAPVIIVVAAAVQWQHAKIPATEQIIAVGAAVENMILIAHSLGYGTFWRTGPAAYDPIVKQGLGLATTDEIVSFLYLGTVSVPGPLRKIDLTDLVTHLE